MKNIEKEILGFTVPIIGVCETIGELTTASGSEAQVVADCNMQVLAHSHYGVMRNVVVKVLEAATGIKRKTSKNKLTKENEDDETHGKYVARLLLDTGLSEEQLVEQHASAVAAEAGKVPVDYTPGVRGSGEDAIPAKKWLNYYDQMVAENKVDLYVAKFGIDPTLTGDELKYALANGAKKKVLAAQQAAAATALAL